MRPLVVAAGIFRINPLRFLALIFVARAVRYGEQAYASVHLGESALMLLERNALEAVVVLAALGVFSFVLHREQTRRPPVLLFAAAKVERGQEDG